MKRALAVLGLCILVGCKPAPVEVKAPAAGALDPTKYAVYFTRYPFGGRTTDAWRERLEELKPGGARADAALYAFTVERARKNGLVVEPLLPDAHAPIVVQPNAELTAALMKRLDVK
jgi:hypothetical protein